MKGGFAIKRLCRIIRNPMDPSPPEQSPPENLVPENLIPATLGRYQLLRSLGKGGMGEVFLAYDPVCCRQIALKAIRADLQTLAGIHQRFLREAQLAAELTHPAVIPIYAIHQEGDQVYYTMPYVEGETLRAILERMRPTHKASSGEMSAGSIPSLMRVFAGVCQAIAYAHSKQVLHCDIKPANVIVGSFGQVVILDWGLARPIHSDQLADEGKKRKAAGTLPFMAPELILGLPPTVLTDVYALGVTLYELLTLRAPFRRGGVAELRQQLKQPGYEEEWIDPAEAAPYRDVPPALARIARRCLETAPQQRYQSVTELLRDLDAYMEGRPEWLQMARLRLNRPADWQFHEHFLLSEHAAVTRALEGAEWVGLMVSRRSMGENLRIRCRVCLGATSQGVGLLINVPESGLRTHLTEGLCLWLHGERLQGTKLLRSGMEVMDVPDVYLPRGQFVELLIQKTDSRIQVFLDGVEQFSYIASFPIVGTYMGVLYRDTDFEMGDIEVSAGGLTAQVNCLAVPDALAANRLFDRALAEYRRIGRSFVGRAEGREGMFRAGICLLERARVEKEPAFYQAALTEFEKLRRTPGAPLEYLGKAIVYQALDAVDEETKCLELALRKYARHPLSRLLEEQVIFRIHQSAQRDRRATYRLLFIAIRLLPAVLSQSNVARLIQRLRDHWEPLPWIRAEDGRLTIALQLGFWLNQPFALEELIGHLESPAAIEDAVFCLLELGYGDLAVKYGKGPAVEAVPKNLASTIAAALAANDQRSCAYLAERAIDWGQPALALLATAPWKGNDQLDAIAITARLWMGDFTPPPTPTERLMVPYGCWLMATQGVDAARSWLSQLVEEPYPRTWTLLGHYLLRGPAFRHAWRRRAFWWEQQQLYRQLALYYQCAGNPARAEHYLKRLSNNG